MNERINYTECPSCKSVAISKVFSCKDHTVTQEVFEVWTCACCTLRFTQNVPVAEDMGRYYQSAAYVSHSDTKKGLVNRIYHLVRNRTLRQKLKLVRQVTGKTTGTLLDVGAGTGAFAYTMKQAGWQVTGLEPDEIARTNASNNYGLALDTLDSLPSLPAASFDVITLWHVMEHVHDLHGYLRNFFKLIRESGFLIIAVPNYCSYDAEVYQNCWAAYDVPRHLYHFSNKSMEFLLHPHGFTVEQLKPMWYDSFYVSMLSENHMRNHGNVARAFWNGLLSNMKALRHGDKCSSIIYIIRRTEAPATER